MAVDGATETRVRRKLRAGQVVRLAGLLHVADHADDHQDRDHAGGHGMQGQQMMQGHDMPVIQEDAHDRMAGKPGDPVLAAAPGRVMYTGTGIRGYGKLIVIKHDNNFNSVYAHNRENLVKMDQTIARGQKIAEIGSSDADSPKLRRNLAEVVGRLRDEALRRDPLTVEAARRWQRNFMDGLRSAGVETGGHAAYGPREKQAFANALDRALTRALRPR